MQKPSRDPFDIEVTRGTMVESRHRVALAICDSQGNLIDAFGDVRAPIYGRSAIKPLQALPLVESGAADHYALGEREIALACASHNGEAEQVDTVRAWLQHIGCSLADLECGSHLPYHEPTAHAMLHAGQIPDASHNNCSGKHAGFLTTARFFNEPLGGYIQADHPVQKRVRQVLEDLGGEKLTDAPHGVDGCGIPVIGLSLQATARALASLADPSRLPPQRAEAARRIVRAMAAHPFMVAGNDRFCTTIMKRTGLRAVIKAGAEGVYSGIFPDLGYGVALKVHDGAGRAAEVAMGWALNHLGVLTDADRDALRDQLTPTLRNRAGVAAGVIRPAI